MGGILRSLPLLLILLGYCTPENDIDIVIVTLNTVVEKQNELLQKFNEQERRLEAQNAMMLEQERRLEAQHTMMLELQTTMSIMQESLNTVEENVEQQQERARSLQQCSTKDQIYDLLDLHVTDECYAGNTNCSEMATCIDTFGHYRCVCLPGYSGNGFSCEDVDECAERPDLCSGEKTCVNLPGDYRCDCPHGYKAQGNTCQDVNECKEGEEEGVPNCHPRATCHNNVGSFECRCLSGYTGDGHTCVSGSDCNPPSHVIPGLGCIIPVKERKTWDDAQETCRRKGARLVEGIKAEHIRMLEQHFFNYIGRTWVHIGLRDGMWVTSRDRLSPEDPLWIEGAPGKGDDKICVHAGLNRPLDNVFADWFCSEMYPSLCQRHNVK